MLQNRNAELIKEACEELEDLNWFRSHYTPASKQHSASTTYFIDPAIRSGHIKTSTLTTATADSFPTVATLATDEQGAFLKSEGYSGHPDLETAASLVTGFGIESMNKPTLATDQRGPFEDNEDFFSENKTHPDSVQTTPYEEEYI